MVDELRKATFSIVAQIQALRYFRASTSMMCQVKRILIRSSFWADLTLLKCDLSIGKKFWLVKLYENYRLWATRKNLTSFH